MSTGEVPIPWLAMRLSLAACLVLAGCASTGPSSTPGSTDVATPAAVPAGTQLPSIEPTTTASAVLGTDAPATLVIRSMTCNDVCGPNAGTTIVSDGRVIWRPEGSPDGALAERTLTGSGLQAVREAIDATRLLDADGAFGVRQRPGTEPPGHGTTSHVLRTTRGDHRVTVSTDDPGTFEADNNRFGTMWDIPPQAYVLSDLANKLSDPEAWLPAQAWADARRPYEAEAYLLVVTAERSQELPPFVDVDRVHWPLPSSVDTVGQPFAEEGTVVEHSRCLPITHALAMALTAAELDAGYARSLAVPYTDLPYAWARGRGSISVALRQLMPDQPVSCIGGGAW
jgi:hypothetical protein